MKDFETLFENLERRMVGMQFRSRWIANFTLSLSLSLSLLQILTSPPPGFVSQSNSKLPLPVRKSISKTKPKMKVSSLPNLNREATSFPNFFTFIQDPADHEDDGTALQIDEHSRIKKIKIDEHSCDTETSETSPYKEILSPSVLFDKTNEIGFLAGTSSVRVFRSESDHNDRTRPNSVSVGSNQFGGSEWPNLPSCGATRATSPISQETIELPFSPLCPTKRAFTQTQIHTFQFLEIKEATMTEAGTSKSSRSETPAPLPPFSKASLPNEAVYEKEKSRVSFKKPRSVDSDRFKTLHFSKDECEYLINFAKPHAQKSFVVDSTVETVLMEELERTRSENKKLTEMLVFVCENYNNSLKGGTQTADLFSEDDSNSKSP